MSDSGEAWAAVLEAANAELRARFARLGWPTLAAAARQAGVSKGSMHYAIKQAKIRSVRLLPEAGRAAVLVLVHPGDLAAYVPRAYPRGKE